MIKQMNNSLLGSVFALLISASAMAADNGGKQGISIVGNRELPKAVTILPWEKAKSEAIGKHPVGSILDDEVTAVDRDELRRENYYQQLMSADQ